ncbi:MAG TPA: hypothetical protein VD994_09010 [Prosthecobacter sp.]|nr:hypothetical protein [Prosthecobacter sp.]
MKKIPLALALIAVVLAAWGYFAAEKHALELSDSKGDIVLVGILSEYVKKHHKLPRDWQSFQQFNDSTGRRLEATTAQLEGRFVLRWELPQEAFAQEQTLLWRLVNGREEAEPDLSNRLKALVLTD